MTMASEQFDAMLKARQAEAESAIEQWAPPASAHPMSLYQAMRYSLDAGGKRLRPILLISAAKLYSQAANPAPAATAIEMVHTYSLIHDDLPCMDNSDLRRGKPTCHVAFDEATALLAGDALLTEAFALLARAYADNSSLALALIQDLAEAAGAAKLIGGQIEDLAGETLPPDAERLAYIQHSKTAALLQACLMMGIRLSAAGSDEVKLNDANELGLHLGIAFQIVDDILDATADEATLGKTTGLDEANGTLTHPGLYGMERSREAAQLHTQQALECVERLGGDNEFLRALVNYLLNRVN